jgi:hypothetical protein
MTGIQVRMNAGTISGIVLLLIGAALWLTEDGGQVAGYPLRTIGFGVIVLALIVYGAGRVVTIVRTPRR